MTLRRTISKDEIYQKFNLKRLLGENPTPDQKELFFELAVEKMVDRTVEGNDIKGTKFKRYSEKYAAKKGVSRDSVDMVLEGDMLDGFDNEAGTPSTVTIAMKESELLKSYNHLKGDTLPKRDFFGFKSEDDIKDILKEVKKIAPKKTSKKKVERETVEMLERETNEMFQSEAVQSYDLAELRAAVNEIDLDFGEF